MRYQPELTEPEWELVLSLLQIERRELPVEIHHTDNNEAHDALCQKLRLVDQLIRRIEASRAEPAPS